MLTESILKCFYVRKLLCATEGGCVKFLKGGLCFWEILKC